jgi:hypothetical protein
MNPLTGEVRSQVTMDGHDPDTGEDLHAHVKVVQGDLRMATMTGLSSLPVASADILASDGDYIFMKSQSFDLEGKRLRIAQLDVNSQRGDDAHLFVPNGFLDDEYWHRAFWVYGRSVVGGPGYSATGHATPCGKLMVLDDKKIYVFGRQDRYWRWTTPTEYRLFSVDRSLPKPRKPKEQFDTGWSVDIPILARAMVKAGNTVFACGPRDIVPEEQFKARKSEQLDELRRQAALYSGSDGSMLCAVSAEDGKTLNQAKLDVLPVFDGMIAAGGKLFVATIDGKIVCLAK